MLFKDVIAQQELKEQLIKTIKSNKVSHAQLFCGQEGSGHFAMAVAYTQYLLCQNRAEDSCGTCSSCVKIQQLAHPDVHFSFPVHLSKTNKITQSDDVIKEFREMISQSPYIGISHWNEFLGNQNKQGIIAVKESEAIIKKLSLKAYEGSYKILIMWLPELMNKEAANKLLKLIEEPPKKTIFLLVADSADKIIDTILSRTQKVNFLNLKAEEIKMNLISRHQLSNEKAEYCANLADGNFHKAEQNINSNENDNFYLSSFVSWMRLCYSRNISDTIDWVDEMATIGREQQKEFLLFSLEMFRQCIIGHYSGETLTLLNDKQHQFLSKFSPFINHLNIVGLDQTINKAYYHLERNANPKILLLDVSLKFYSLLKKV
ncbi:MAG: DNA polymerase III subunit delta' [Flavobacteriales bacterium]|nr:DNA polymerase III subunit delta' [Flavobacteriales bacterium]